VGALVGWGLQKVETPVIKPLLQGGLCLIAIAMLSWMLLWMTQNAKSLKGDIENSLQQVLTQDDSQNNQGGWAVFFLILTALLREGPEIAVLDAIAPVPWCLCGYTLGKKAKSPMPSDSNTK
jgi:high-affinity iron transporter